MLISEAASSRDSLLAPSPSLPPPNEQERTQLIEAEQVRLIAAQAPIGLVEGVLAVGVTVLVLWNVVALWALLGWVLLMGLLNVPGSIILWRFRRTTPTPQQIRIWATLFTAAYGLSGIGWGSSALLFLPMDSLGYQLFLVFIIGGQSAGGMTALSSVPKVLHVFLVTTLSPAIVKLCSLGDGAMTAIGLMLLVFGVAMAMIGRRLHAVLEETLRLRFENLDLVRDLSLAKERAEAASQAKSQFLANMSHELRTPMHGVLGVMEMLQQTTLTDRQRKMILTAHRSGKALLRIIDELLDLSRIEAGKLELEQVDFNVRQVLDEVMTLFAENANRKGLRLTCQIQDDAPTSVRGDPARLRQVLINLVGNALKFTERGEVSVEVQQSKFKVQSQPLAPSTFNFELETLNSYLLHFSVRDTGIGIAADTGTRIFDSFAQADESTTRKYGGTGLGLSIAKQLTELMGGEIGVESEEGKGSTFWFTAHFAPALAPVQIAAPAEAHDLGVSDEMKPEISRWWSINILLVEDNPLNQEVTRSLLEMFGCRVDVAENGRQALDRLVGSSYDLVFLDCQMPEMDGFATAMEIRRREALQSRTQALPATSPELPFTNGLGALRSSRVLIVALTANAMAGDRERCLAAGMDDYLSKPFSLQELEALLQRWLSEKAQDARGCDNHNFNYRMLDVIRELPQEDASRFFAAVLRSFLTEAPKLMLTLRDAVARSDAEVLHQAAHTLKSNSASLGARTLATICGELEAMGREGRASEAVRLLPLLEAEYLAAEHILSTELQRSA